MKGQKWLRFYLTEDSIWRLTTFLTETLGIEAGTKSINELIAEVPGKQFIFSVMHEASQDGSAIYAGLKGTAKV